MQAGDDLDHRRIRLQKGLSPSEQVKIQDTHHDLCIVH